MKTAPFPVVLAFCVLLLVSCGPSNPAPAPGTAEAPMAPPAAQAEPAPVAEPAPSVAQEPKAEKTEKSDNKTVKAVPSVPASSGAAGTTPAPSAPAPAVEPGPAAPPEPVPPAPAVPAGPVVPPPAPDLHLDPLAAVQAGPVTVKTSALPAGTVVRYTLDGSDPASGKAWPAGGLAVGQSAKLRVWAAQPGGDAATAEALYTVGELWVQPGGQGDGSWSHPLGTVDEALAKAGPLGIKRLRLTTGQWTGRVDLSGNWELSGGWKAPGEPGSGPSVLVGAKASSTQKDPAFTLRVGPSAKVALSGLDIRSPNSSFGAAVLVDAGGTLEVSASRLSGGAGLYGYGLRASGAALVTVSDSTLYGGDGGSSFALSAEKSTVRVLRSTFDAGTGNAVSYGLNMTLSKLSLASSVVWGGAANSSYGVGLYSSDGSSIQGSTILGGKGASAWALYLSESDPEIVNCLVGSAGKSKSYGIFVNYGKSQPRALRSNAFFGSATGAFTGADLGAVSADPGEGGAFTDPSGKAFAGQKGNFRAEPALGPAPDFRTLASSPASILKGGEGVTGDAAVDRGGKPRGTSPTIGAWTVGP